MFQWDAVDISRDLLGQNVLKIFELATRHNKRTTRTELERERESFRRWNYFNLHWKIYSWFSYGGGESYPQDGGENPLAYTWNDITSLSSHVYSHSTYLRSPRFRSCWLGSSVRLTAARQPIGYRLIKQAICRSSFAVTRYYWQYWRGISHLTLL